LDLFLCHGVSADEVCTSGGKQQARILAVYRKDQGSEGLHGKHQASE